MNEETLLACSTFPEIETARRIAQQLVTENLAACANIIPAVESIYRWQDKIENAQETWQRVFRDAERAVLRKTAEAFPELGFLPAQAREFVLWHSKGRLKVGRRSPFLSFSAAYQEIAGRPGNAWEAWELRRWRTVGRYGRLPPA